VITNYILVIRASK